MNSALQFRDWSAADDAACLALFDANCPEYFAPNERADYEAFLAEGRAGYRVCTMDGSVVGAWGVFRVDDDASALNWILLSPATQGRGIGRAIMDEVKATLRARGHARLHIAASHRSAPFFAHFGAVERERIPDGWGPGMHRVEMEMPAR